MRPARRRRRRPRRTGVGRVPGRRSITTASASHGRRCGAAANFEENSPKVRCWLRSLDQAERRDVPERRGAAVAEHDLVALGQREQLGEPLAHPADQARTGACRCEVPMQRRAGAASAASCSGRTLEGPQPNRPSAGSRSAGMLTPAAAAPAAPPGAGPA